MTPFAGVTFLGAFLLFLVQPLLARQILPWFGGAQSVWTVCLLFYQTALLAGYSYAHLGRRLGGRGQAAAHAALLLASLALLPITASERWKPTPEASPTWWLLGLLATTVGGPYVLLSATAPLVQSWLARARPGRPPYALYALSNAASLLALLAYPVVVEPLLSVTRQSVWWSWGYAAFALTCSALAIRAARAAPARGGSEEEAADVPAPGGADLALWVALSACGSGLLLALTNHMTMDVAAVPFLWVLPLAAYLGTFVLAFAGRYRRATWGAFLVLGLAAMALLWDAGFSLPLAVQIGVSTAVLFVACMVCHGELARSAPPPSRLTTFYVTVAGGGALGGALVAVVAPATLPNLWEVPAFLLLALALLIVVVQRERTHPPAGPLRTARLAALGVLLFVATAGFVLPTLRRTRGTVATRRGFYGVLRVQDAPAGILSEQRVLLVGRIFHGGQFLDSARSRAPTAYFVAGSGVERAIRGHPKRRARAPLRIGVVGLGVGTLAAWAEPGDSVRFYEINPDVEAVARRWFTFLEDTPATVTVAVGDGRLSLERELASAGTAPRFDVLVVDAFTGDAVPVHLLTVEAARLYARALAEGGVLVFNVTNRHVDLEPVVRGLADAAGMHAVRMRSVPPTGDGGIPSTWMLVARSREFLDAVAVDEFPVGPRRVLWTDDHSDLLGVLR
jgi:hypothetical protein